MKITTYNQKKLLFWVLGSGSSYKKSKNKISVNFSLSCVSFHKNKEYDAKDKTFQRHKFDKFRAATASVYYTIAMRHRKTQLHKSFFSFPSKVFLHNVYC